MLRKPEDFNQILSICKSLQYFQSPCEVGRAFFVCELGGRAGQSRGDDSTRPSQKLTAGAGKVLYNVLQLTWLMPKEDRGTTD